jgi:hypothetical protein
MKRGFKKDVKISKFNGRERFIHTIPTALNKINSKKNNT